MATNSLRGSEWSKWDLHIHTPFGKLCCGYKTNDGTDVLDKFCEEIEKSDVSVFGITDYFSVHGFNTFITRFQRKYPHSHKTFFFNLELRLNESVNKKLEEVNIHLLFNPNSVIEVDKFLSKLTVVKTGKDEKPITCSDLKTDEDFQAATVTRKNITDAFENTYGKKAIREEHFLVITAANNDGLRPERGKKRKEEICDEIDKFSNAFFGGSQNINYYLDTNRYGDDVKALKMPVISGSDCHSFEDLKNYLGKRYVKTIENEGEKIELISKDITWIKAEPTYEGLKQILYEPEPGERVSISQVKPDLKEDYKIIRKIKFVGSKDFPEEIEFNDNLCSIIGSRSSGKSALLSYIAHSIDPTTVEAITDGPGEGEQYSWSRIKGKIAYSIEWANGRINAETPGSIVYIRQNYLFEKSKDPNEIKIKIEPVLFKTLPNFEHQYKLTNLSINEYNNKISDCVDDWFTLNDNIRLINDQLKGLGDKKAIEQEKASTENKIESLKKKYELSEEDLKTYQKVTKEVSELKTRCTEIDKELISIKSSLDKSNYFTSVIINLTPAYSSLPINLQEIIKKYLAETQAVLLKDVNGFVCEFKDALIKEKSEKNLKISEIEEANKELIEKYKKNDELQKLVASITGYTEILKKIGELELSIKNKEIELAATEKNIADALGKRIESIKALDVALKSSDQSNIKEIKFDLEYKISNEDLQLISSGINLRDHTDFVNKEGLNIDAIRKDSTKFLADLYSGKQKIIARYDKKRVAIDTLRLTEKILFTAQMEGDKIGGFLQSTMTPGKRALFALRLILAESADTWPLLIDQPEDDLDSRSIYDEVVPFLKEKKKERQIIMVSHNANLVIGSDSEQIIVANRHGNDRQNEDGKQFNYLTGSLEYSKKKDEKCKDTLKCQGICEHACSILDGGKTAFEIRKNKYQIH